MRVVAGVAELRAAVREARGAGGRVALVPTMGNLHEGHVALLRRAHELAAFTVASIFVNPFQFAPGEDFGSYPRTPESDHARLESEGVQLLFAPETAEIYPRGPERSARVEVPRLGELLDGLSRPHFFRGVATVCNILFNAVQPDAALFGEKDYQQLLVVRRMAADLHMPLEVVGVPTVRHADGLAMSSRNGYLSEDERRRAPALYGLLCEARDAIRAGECDFQSVGMRGMEGLESQGFRPDYFSVRRAEDLEPAEPGDERLVILAAAWLGRARLIDNVGVY